MKRLSTAKVIYNKERKKFHSGPFVLPVLGRRGVRKVRKVGKVSKVRKVVRKLVKSGK